MTTNNVINKTNIASSGANGDITSMTGLSGSLKAPTGFLDPNSHPTLALGYVGSAVNYISLSNSATGNAPILSVTGTDGNINMSIQTTSGDILLSDNGAAIAPAFRWYNSAATHYVGFKAPALTGNQIWALPTADGTSGQVVQTDGSGNLSFVTAGGGSFNYGLSTIMAKGFF